MLRVRTISAIVVLAMLVGVGLLAGDSVKAEPTVTVFTAGVNDNFALPTEPASPSANFLGFLGTNRIKVKDFDDPTIDRFIAHTFTNLPACVVGATLEIHLRAGNSFLSHNDSLSLFFVGSDQTVPPLGPERWARFISTAHGFVGVLPFDWHFGKVATLVFDLGNLPLAPSQPASSSNLIPSLNQHGFLDFAVQDDTDIDFMILTVTSNDDDDCADDDDDEEEDDDD